MDIFKTHIMDYMNKYYRKENTYFYDNVSNPIMMNQFELSLGLCYLRLKEDFKLQFKKFDDHKYIIKKKYYGSNNSTTIWNGRAQYDWPMLLEHEKTDYISTEPHINYGNRYAASLYIEFDIRKFTDFTKNIKDKIIDEPDSLEYILNHYPKPVFNINVSEYKNMDFYVVDNLFYTIKYNKIVDHDFFINPYFKTFRMNVINEIFEDQVRQIEESIGIPKLHQGWASIPSYHDLLDNIINNLKSHPNSHLFKWHKFCVGNGEIID